MKDNRNRLRQSGEEWKTGQTWEASHCRYEICIFETDNVNLKEGEMNDSLEEKGKICEV